MSIEPEAHESAVGQWRELISENELTCGAIAIELNDPVVNESVGDEGSGMEDGT